MSEILKDSLFRRCGSRIDVLDHKTEKGGEQE